MSGFSADWLTLREPLDLAARDKGLLREAIRLLPARGGSILDLGAGTGSTFRAFASAECGLHDWRLVDNDADLLAEAKRLCGANVEIEQADLGDLDGISFEQTDLVTASALLDLCPESWLRALAARVVDANAVFYAALNYDGDIHWRPVLPDDARMIAAFDRHQATDKGLGPALGPDAGRRIEKIFAELGYSVSRALSPWRIGPSMRDMHAAFIDGMASAVIETAEVDASTVREWVHDRKKLQPEATCVVGHLDLLARPVR